jgi:hypothetical protein
VAQPTDLVDDRTLIAHTTSQGATAGGKAVTVTNAGVIASPGATFTYAP